MENTLRASEEGFKQAGNSSTTMEGPKTQRDYLLAERDVAHLLSCTVAGLRRWRREGRVRRWWRYRRMVRYRRDDRDASAIANSVRTSNQRDM